MGDDDIEEVRGFCYLGSLISKDGIIYESVKTI